MVQKAQRVVPLPALLFVEGATAGRIARIERDEVTVGRRPANDVVLSDPRVSRVHAVVRQVADTLVVTDLGSSAGTFVNGERVTGPTAVHHGDALAFGPVTCRFEDPAQASVAEDPTMVLDTTLGTDAPHLSPRQRQVLALMAEGMTNSEIGVRLGVTERTIKAYAQDLYDRLGVRNRAGAVAEAAKAGLL